MEQKNGLESIIKVKAEIHDEHYAVLIYQVNPEKDSACWRMSMKTDSKEEARSWFKIRWALSEMAEENLPMALANLKTKEEITLTDGELPNIHDFSNEDLLSDYY